MFRASNIHYDVADRVCGLAAGGIGVVHLLAKRSGLIEAIIEADGMIAPTCGECKEGMAISYNGQWGYHPLIVALANTGEPLFLDNRSGNRPSHEGAAERFDQAIELCRRAGFAKITLRGDTDFTQTHKFDAWDALSLPVSRGRWADRHRAQRQEVLRMKFKRFVNVLIVVPCQIIRTGRRVVYRLLSWNNWQAALLRAADAWRVPMRC